MEVLATILRDVAQSKGPERTLWLNVSDLEYAGIVGRMAPSATRLKLGRMTESTRVGADEILSVCYVRIYGEQVRARVAFTTAQGFSDVLYVLDRQSGAWRVISSELILAS